MVTPSEKLADSLAELKSLQDEGISAIKSLRISRTHRERLQRAGFIMEVIKGWYLPTRPDESPGETTGWYAAFWAFIADYLNDRFGNDWCLSAEQSISLHAGDWTVPRQLLVRSPKGGNKPTALLHDTSVLDVRLVLPPDEDVETRDRLRIVRLPAALISCAPGQFVSRPTELRSALGMIGDASEISRRLLSGGHSKVAGRLAGAFRNVGRDRIADDILAAMRAAHYTVSEFDPFDDQSPIVLTARDTSPYVNRLRILWQEMRGPILEHFRPPGARTDVARYLKHVDSIYVDDAYNSLSIEGYRVNAELIERVRAANWNPEKVKADWDQRNALAARGYWQAFRAVRRSVEKVLSGQNPGKVADTDHSAWYRELFGPSVTAGLAKPADLAGYRNGPVYIRRSMHVPPRIEAVRELMPAFFEQLRQEKEPAVRAVLGHFVFVWIHPYMDGNGRMGRFLMNLMMASGGYPWTIVPLSKRDEYMAALERASVGHDIVPFTKFLAHLIASKKKKA